MRIEKIKLGDKVVMPFTIPSGIVMTDPRCAKRILELTPEIGIWSTKSTGLKERVMPTEELYRNNPEGLEFGCREPIFAQLGDGTYANAIKLINEGAKKTREKIERAEIPKDRVILASIFAENENNLVKIVETLEPVADAFEWNGGCPHGERVGISQGQDSKIVYSFIKAIVRTTGKPVLFKVPWNVTRDSIRAAVEAGAYGLAGINTVPVEPLDEEGNHLLWNKKGGKSGRGIKQIGLQRTREIREAAGNLLMIVMGGISTVKDIEDYAEAARGGPVAYGIGTATIGMSEGEIAGYFSTLVSDIENKTNNAEGLLKKVNMQYKKVKITEKIEDACDMKIFRTNKNIHAEPGQFVFAWIPGVGEKPFSVMDDEPLTLGILERGEFTKKFNSLKERDEFYFRGPYGKSVNVPDLSDVILVGGGCGIAGLYLLAKNLSNKSNIISLLAAKDKEHIPYIKEFEKYGEVKIATEDGSYGRKGLVTDLIRDLNLKEGIYFFNCGSRAMVNAVLPLELKVSNPNKIYFSIEYTTRCGVGICGSCANERGLRTCVEGPFINLI